MSWCRLDASIPLRQVRVIPRFLLQIRWMLVWIIHKELVSNHNHWPPAYKMQSHNRNQCKKSQEFVPAIPMRIVDSLRDSSGQGTHESFDSLKTETWVHDNTETMHKDVEMHMNIETQHCEFWHWRMATSNSFNLCIKDRILTTLLAC